LPLSCRQGHFNFKTVGSEDEKQYLQVGGAVFGFDCAASYFGSLCPTLEEMKKAVSTSSPAKMLAQSR